MRYCWICNTYITDGQETKDHIDPFRKGYEMRAVGWFWAHKYCNNTRSNLPIFAVEKIQRELDRKYGNNWTQEHICDRMREELSKRDRLANVI